MSDTSIVSMSPIQVLKQDHRTLKELFAEYAKLEEGDPAEKEDLFGEIKELLTIHAEIEEQLFYPAVRAIGTKEAADVVNGAVEEHQLVKTLLEEMSDLEAGDEEFEAKMKVLRENVEHHAREEEKDMFPLSKKLSKEAQESLRNEMESLRIDLSDRPTE
jgi:hemerythrin superfamily protein